MLIDQCEIDYAGMITCTERQEYQERVAHDLRAKHHGQVKQSMLDPEFCVVGQGSRLNYLHGIPGYQNMTDKEFIQCVRAESVNEFWLTKKI